MGNRTIGMIGVLSCLLGVNAVSYAGEAGNDVSKNSIKFFKTPFLDNDH